MSISIKAGVTDPLHFLEAWHLSLEIGGKTQFQIDSGGLMQGVTKLITTFSTFVT